MNLTRSLLDRASMHPEKEALIFEGQGITYGDLSRKVGYYAALLKNLGVRKGDRIALQLPKSLEFLLLHLANLSLGGVTLPVNTLYRPEETAYFLSDSESALLVTRSENFLALKPVLASLPNLACLVTDRKADGAMGPLSIMEQAPAGATQGLFFEGEGDDTAMICYTSGTTGKPKGAMISHRNLLENIRGLVQVWHWTAQDRLLHVLPLFHVHGLCVAVHGGLFAGCTLILHERFDPEQVWRTIEEQRCTLFMGVPTMYHRMLNSWKRLNRKPDIRSVRVFISGSAPLPEELFHQFRRATGHTILERYGMTETLMNTSNPYEVLGRIPGSVGYPLPGVRVRVVDDQGNDTNSRHVGEVWIRGPNVFKGYWKRPDQTAEVFRETWFRSGDLGYLDEEDQGRLYLVGRAKDLIITGGYNVYPKEVEQVLERAAGVGECAVIGLPDEDLGERVVAVVVPADRGLTTPDPGRWAAFCKKHLAAYKCPKDVFLRDALPRNAMGKTEKRVLAKEYSEYLRKPAQIDPQE